MQDPQNFASSTLDNPTLGRPSFVADKVGTYQVSLVATTVLGLSSDPVFLAIQVDPCGTAALNPIVTSFLSELWRRSSEGIIDGRGVWL